jgi:hypothetical protein
MRDHMEKYLNIQLEFPNRAGKLAQVLATQKRLAEELAKRPQDDNTKRLLIATAEGYDVGMELLEWFKTQLQEFCNDAHILKDGAKMRNIIEEQSQFVSFFLQSK